MTKKPKFKYSANDVWAAACFAQRVNKSYVKFVEEGSNKVANRDLMYKLLDNNNKKFSVEDKNQGVKVRQHYQAISFRMLTESYINDFEKNAMVIADKEIIESPLDVAIIASLPQAYNRAVLRKQENKNIAEATTNKTVGKVGDRVNLTVTVLKTTLSQKFGCYFVTAKTDNEEVVFFASSNIHPAAGEVIDIRGTVKCHKQNDNGMTTQLNRVKQFDSKDILTAKHVERFTLIEEE